jgi:ABC-type nickel/cobalt efflux system permease component RcnA
MALDTTLGLFGGAVALGAVHGVEPGHGWPVAASYALDQAHQWTYGLAASLLIGIGHLVSSIAMVAVFFYAKAYFDLAQVDAPLTAVGIRIGGPVSVVAGVVLIALGIREYRHGHSHGHDHDHDDYDTGPLARLRGALPFGGGSDGHASFDGETDRGLFGIAWFAFVLGFAHEEEFEIIALCAGSSHCLELMTAYALTVILGIVGFTLFLIAGYQQYEARVERYTPYLPLVSATVLVAMGLGFVAGVF